MCFFPLLCAVVLSLFCAPSPPLLPICPGNSETFLPRSSSLSLSLMTCSACSADWPTSRREAKMGMQCETGFYLNKMMQWSCCCSTKPSLSELVWPGPVSVNGEVACAIRGGSDYWESYSGRQIHQPTKFNL